MAALKQSYVHGASEVPLIGETIGQFFDAVCDKHADSAGAGRAAPEGAAHLRRIAQRGRQARRRIADAWA